MAQKWTDAQRKKFGTTMRKINAAKRAERSAAKTHSIPLDAIPARPTPHKKAQVATVTTNRLQFAIEVVRLLNTILGHQKGT